MKRRRMGKSVIGGIWFFTLGLAIHLSTCPVRSQGFYQVKPLSDSNSDCTTAKSYSIKIINGNSRGSGLVIHKQNSKYRIVTNKHVVAEYGSYSVITHDGKMHDAEVVSIFSGDNLSSSDISILEFESEDTYPVAEFESWKVGDKVFAAGYSSNVNNAPAFSEFVCTNWANSRKLQKPMEEGYQLGAPIEILRGMSGGPLFNAQGRVVGINGKGPPAIFVNPDLYTYRTGEHVSEPLEELAKLSWAIPIDIVADHPTTLPLKIAVKQNQETSEDSIAQQSNIQRTALLDSWSALQEELDQVENDTEFGEVNEETKNNETSSDLLQGEHSVSERARMTVSPIFIEPFNRNQGVRRLIGSGILVGNQNNEYYLLACRCILENQEEYTSFTSSDRQFHELSVVDFDQESNLVLFKFVSQNIYDFVRLEDIQDTSKANFARWENSANSVEDISFSFLENIHTLSTSNENNIGLFPTHPNLDFVGKKGFLLNQKGDLLGIQTLEGLETSTSAVQRLIP